MDIVAIRHKGCDDTLRRAERLLFLGIASAVAYFLLVATQSTAAPTVNLALIGMEIQTTAARVLTAGFSWIVGLFSAFEIQRVQQLLRVVPDDDELLKALRYSPVSTVSPTPLIAFGPPVAAALILFVAFLVGSLGNEHRDAGERVLAAAFLALPYVSGLPVLHSVRKLLNAAAAE